MRSLLARHPSQTRKCALAIDVINLAKNMAGTMGMSPAVQAKFAWSLIEMHNIRDWIFWALGKSQWVRGSLAYKISGLRSP